MVLEVKTNIKKEVFKMKSLKEALNLDSYDRDKITKIELSHEEKYDKIIEILGFNNIKKFIPFTKEQVQEALKSGDKYLNTLPLRTWDMAAISIQMLCRNKNISTSLAEQICILKNAAKKL